MRLLLSIIVLVNLFSAHNCLKASNKEHNIKPFIGRIAQGGSFSFDDYLNAKALAIVFTCNHCPFAQLYIDRMNAFHQKYAPQGIPLIAINPMDSLVYDDETFSLMQQKAQKEHFLFPYVHDVDQSIARMFGAEHTPQVFVIQKFDSTWRIVYKGIIDDNGKEPEKAIPYLQKTADAILQHQTIAPATLKSFGCKIYYRK